MIKHRRKNVAIKLGLLLLGTVLLFGIYLSFNPRSSDEFKELRRQEEALQLPQPDKRSSADEGCRWVSEPYWEEDSGEEYWSCARRIVLTYHDIRLAGQIRDRLVANGWNEEGYHEHIGPTKQPDALSIDQISQGDTPRRASNSDYYFSPKATPYGNLCAQIKVWAQGDDRNPNKPRLIIYLNGLYGKSQSQSC